MKEMPLKGIRVIDLTMWAQGPIASMLLADNGAEVIKIEHPVTGDPSRGLGLSFGRSIWLPDGRNLMWEAFNRNKKGITLDLQKEAAQEVLYRLAKKSDIFVTNFTQRALRKVRADYQTIRGHNPQIIYARAGGFGSKGPDAEAPCQDTSGMARSGLMFNTPAADGSPVYPVGAFSDVLSGTMLCFGILMALVKREKTGVVEGVYASQLGAMMWLQFFNIAAYTNLGYDFPPFNRNKERNPLTNLYKCQDDKWLAVGLAVSTRFWPDFCEVMGIKDLEKDPHFDTEEKRAENAPELIRKLNGIFASRAREEWEMLFKEKGFWFSVINRVGDLPADVQVVQNNFIREFVNGLRLVSSPFELEKTEIPLEGTPQFGQHTEEVLLDICGYTWDEIVAMKESGAI